MTRKTTAGPHQPQPVTRVRVRALGDHEHDGDRYPAGAEFEMSPEAAELSAARGDVELIHHEA